MKYYIDQLKELEILQARIDTLENKRKMYKTLILPKSPNLEKEKTSGGENQDKFLNYVIKLEEIDKQLDFLKEEYDLSKAKLKEMENSIKQMNNVEYNIFKLHDIDHLNIKQISIRTGYSKTHIYRTLKKCKNNYEMGKNGKII